MTKPKMEKQRLTKSQTNSDYLKNATFPLLPWPAATEYPGHKERATLRMSDAGIFKLCTTFFLLHPPSHVSKQIFHTIKLFTLFMHKRGDRWNAERGGVDPLSI